MARPLKAIQSDFDLNLDRLHTTKSSVERRQMLRRLREILEEMDRDIKAAKATLDSMSERLRRLLETS